jgi:crotonobetainyl-CoA:carnitine CoA-transferase CaiB-like acyl-CoA transferase
VARYNEYHGRRADNLRYHYRSYQTADGAIAVGCLSQPLRKRLLGVLGIPGTGELANTGPTDADHEIMLQAEQVFATKSTEEWVSLCDEARVPAGPVNFAEEMWDDAQVEANGMAVELEHSLVGRVRMIGPLVKMSDTPTEARSASPALGEHTGEILGALGYTAERIDALRKAGVTR